jgi:hypothetical protein
MLDLILSPCTAIVDPAIFQPNYKLPNPSRWVYMLQEWGQQTAFPIRAAPVFEKDRTQDCSASQEGFPSFSQVFGYLRKLEK